MPGSLFTSQGSSCHRVKPLSFCGRAVVVLIPRCEKRDVVDVTEKLNHAHPCIITAPDSHTFLVFSLNSVPLPQPQNILHASAAPLSLVSLIFLRTSSCSVFSGFPLSRLRLELVELIEPQSCISVSSDAIESLDEVERKEEMDEERKWSFGRNIWVGLLAVDA